MSNKLTIVADLIDICSKEQLESIFAPLSDLPATSTKAEMLSHCVNKELGAYGFQTYTSPDKTMVLVNDEGVSKILKFLKGEGFRPYLTQEQIDRLKVLHKVSNDNKISIHWEQYGFRKKYYYLKQYGFNGVQLYNIMAVNTQNAAALAASSNGAIGISLSGILALSWSGSIFLATLENYIPNTFVKTKAVVSGLKCITAFPVTIVEATSNAIFGFVETAFIGTALPTNVTAVHKLNIGPKIEDLRHVKKSFFNWISHVAQKLANEI